MKKVMFLAASIAAMVLVGCHQPTKEEQLNREVENVFREYHGDESYSIDSIVYDTAGNSINYLLYMNTVTGTMLDIDVPFLTLAMAEPIESLSNAIHLPNDTTDIVVACLYVRFDGSGVQCRRYCGMRHGRICQPRIFGEDALADVHTEKEQSMYDAYRMFIITLRRLGVIANGYDYDDIITFEDAYDIWVNRSYRVNPNRLAK